MVWQVNCSVLSRWRKPSLSSRRSTVAHIFCRSNRPMVPAGRAVSALRLCRRQLAAIKTATNRRPLSAPCRLDMFINILWNTSRCTRWRHVCYGRPHRALFSVRLSSGIHTTRSTAQCRAVLRRTTRHCFYYASHTIKSREYLFVTTIALQAERLIETVKNTKFLMSALQRHIKIANEREAKSGGVGTFPQVESLTLMLTHWSEFWPLIITSVQ